PASDADEDAIDEDAGDGERAESGDGPAESSGEAAPGRQDGDAAAPF
ncbi:MAG: hypothetical protein JNM25_08165, partial [Planctomycetes bacterium]|nr:hypothetical protein [Planctomycetota bacterium]